MIVLDVYSHGNYEWGMHTTATSYMLIQDSVFTNSEDEHGLYISGSGDHIIVRRNVFQGNSSAGLQINADPQTATLEFSIGSIIPRAIPADGAKKTLIFMGQPLGMI